jgi:hypothetical protein
LGYDDFLVKALAMPRIGLRILRATIAVKANKPELLPSLPLDIEVPSLRTDFHEVAEIPYSPRADGRIEIEDRAGVLTCRISGRRAVFAGPFLRLGREATDIRFSLWGNQGFLYRFVLRLLEERQRIYSFHAAGLLDERRRVLYVIAGGAGSGKTVYLLSGLGRGLRLFSTETVPFKLCGAAVQWFKGSLVDNVRLGTLIHDFPRFLPAGMPRFSDEDAWRTKIALDLSGHASSANALLDPEVVILLPRIEEGRHGHWRRRLDDPRLAAKAFFDNIGQKIGESVVLYDRLVVPGQDTAALAAARLRACRRLAVHRTVREAATVLSGPAECWGDILD